MLVLKSDQVKHCQVICTKTEIPQVLETIYYQKMFFTKGESFPLNNSSDAFKKIVEVLDIEQRTALLLRNSSQLTVYYLNTEVKWIPSINLDTSIKENEREQQQSWFSELRQILTKEISWR